MARSKFAGGDQEYLRTEQYADPSRLARRAGLHARYSTAETGWFPWLAAHVGLAEGSAVLEVGCGAGWMWADPDVTVPPGVELTLTDLSTGMVDEATTRVRATVRFGQVHGRVADAMALPFDDRSFDRVVAAHMLYHAPDPAQAVAELGRVVRADGNVIAATNGRRHMAQLREIEAAVFGPAVLDDTVEAFGVETGFPILRDHFREVRWLAFDDELRCTDPADVLSYVRSMPPGEHASETQVDELRAAIDQRFAVGGGTFVVTKDTGCFICIA
ncbi:MAG: class I SAM-dependent methyltransferase [Ilumatobacteraceae bacterium]